MPSFLVNWRLVSSSDGTEESSEDSSELMLVVGWLLVVWCCHFWKDEVRGSFEHLPTKYGDRKVHWSTLTYLITHVQPRMAHRWLRKSPVNSSCLNKSYKWFDSNIDIFPEQLRNMPCTGAYNVPSAFPERPSSCHFASLSIYMPFIVIVPTLFATPPATFDSECMCYPGNRYIRG